MMVNDVRSFYPALSRAKRRLLDLHFSSRTGHIGGNFSSIDIMMVLHHLVMSDGDRFILSKGHSAGAYYVTLWSLGLLNDDDLLTFCKDGTALPGHPSGVGVPRMDFPTGSLGHGPSLAAGLAHGLRLKNSTNRVFCLCSDGEWQEGSCWEALIFSVHHKLSNLTLIIDQNNFQGLGTTESVVSCKDLGARIAPFGVDLVEVDGHDVNFLVGKLNGEETALPRVIVANTRKGNGLPFEGTVASHYSLLTAEAYDESIRILWNDDNA